MPGEPIDHNLGRNPEEKPELSTVKQNKPGKIGLRARMAGRLIGAAALLSTAIPPQDASPNPSLPPMNNPEAAQQLSIQDLEKRIEQSYMIDIVSPKEEKTGTLFNGENEVEVKPIEWTEEKLILLTDTLNQLPPYFYLPTPDYISIGLSNMGSTSQERTREMRGKYLLEQLPKRFGSNFQMSKEMLDEAADRGSFTRQAGVKVVRFILTDNLPDAYNENGEKILAGCFCGFGEHDILLGNPSVNDSWRIDAGMIVHELTHRVSKEEDYKFVSDLLGVPEGEDFTNFVQDKTGFNNPQIDQHRFDKVDIVSLNTRLAPFFRRIISSYSKDSFAYGTTNPNEFVSTAGAFYILGREDFLTIYGVFIGDEKAEKLYDHMRDKIFNGQEYRKFGEDGTLQIKADKLSHSNALRPGK